MVPTDLAARVATLESLVAWLQEQQSVKAPTSSSRKASFKTRGECGRSRGVSLCLDPRPRGRPTTDTTTKSLFGGTVGVTPPPVAACCCLLFSQPQLITEEYKYSSQIL